MKVESDLDFDQIIGSDLLTENLAGARDELIMEVKEKTKTEEVAIGAIKYAILKQGIGHDVIFDREKSIAVHGDTGVYLQYTYARLTSILNNPSAPPLIIRGGRVGLLNEQTE